jgi:hypothetical protein
MTRDELSTFLQKASDNRIPEWLALRCADEYLAANGAGTAPKDLQALIHKALTCPVQ